MEPDPLEVNDCLLTVAWVANLMLLGCSQAQRTVGALKGTQNLQREDDGLRLVIHHGPHSLGHLDAAALL